LSPFRVMTTVKSERSRYADYLKDLIDDQTLPHRKEKMVAKIISLPFVAVLVMLMSGFDAEARKLEVALPGVNFRAFTTSGECNGVYSKCTKLNVNCGGYSVYMGSNAASRIVTYYNRGKRISIMTFKSNGRTFDRKICTLNKN